MDVRWLQDFLTVAERGNFTKAAQERNASQAAFSRRIQSLETWLGTTLIDRSVFPTRLTAEGERFKEQAAEILRQVLDARADVAALPPRRSLVRIALPHALATGRLPAWWANWPSSAAVLGQIVPSNVHDTVTMLVAGSVDLLICFHHPQQPIHLDTDRYERVVIATERLRPYAATNRTDVWRLPGKSNKPLPLLMYSAGAYLGRMVDLIVEGAPAPLAGTRIMESDMAAVLAAMARQGHGVAWLPDCIAAEAEAELSLLDDDPWTLTLSVVAYRDRANASPALQRLWSSLAAGEAPTDRSPASSAARRAKKGDDTMSFIRLAIAGCAIAFGALPASAQDLTGTLKKIKETGAITIGYRESSIPFSYLDDNQKPVGFAMDICAKIVDAVKKDLKLDKLEVKYNPVTSATRIPLIANGTVDLECGSTTNNAERQKQVAFTNTHFLTASRFVTKKASNVTKIDDLKGKTVVSTSGTTNIKQLNEANAERKLGINIVPAKDHAEAFLMVETDRAVAFVMDDVLLASLVAGSKNPTAYVIPDDAFSKPEPYGIMLRRDDTAFKKIADDATAALYKSPEMAKIYDKWFMAPIPPKNLSLNFPMNASMKKTFASPSDSPDPAVY